MYYDDTEAEHLSDIEDYYEDSFEPYEDWEKKRYFTFKSMSFDKKNIGKWLVVQNSRKNRHIMPTMFLVDRHKTKMFWWSPSPRFAMIFEKESAAKYQAKRYKFNKARAIQISTLMANKEYFESLYEE